MYWKVLISNPRNKVLDKPRKERLYIRNTTPTDTRTAKKFASEYYGVSEELILVIPVDQKELD
jgi:hypothetical protein